MPTQFAVVDFETSNEDMSSICQIGVAFFEDGKYLRGWSLLVNPEDYFSGMNISIHGITEAHVANEPTFPAFHGSLSTVLAGNVVVCHTHFDRIALKQACEKYGLSTPDCKWLDSARVVRRCWPDQFARTGYGLKSVAAFHSIQYTAHDALEDARCAGEILLRAISHSGLALDQWLERVKLAIDPEHDSQKSVHRDGKPDGVLYGEVLVFTGALSEPRQFSADRAAAAGCRVDDGVTKHTTILVVGNQDIRLLAGRPKSSKHLKAEELIAKGKPLRIITERDFLALTAIH